jgi:alkylhydroperoxidase family enzyme
MLTRKILSSCCQLMLIGSVLLMSPASTAGPGGVRLDKPRIEPLHQRAAELIQQERGTRVDPEEIINITAVMANHPDLDAAWNPFVRYIWAKSTLPPRERELVILRIGWLCQAAYEWSHHSDAGIRAGLNQDEILRIIEGPGADGWSQFDRTLLRAADELHADSFITDGTWEALAERYSTKQLMDLVFTIGQYNMVSMALNSFGVQLEKNRQGFPQ